MTDWAPVRVGTEKSWSPDHGGPDTGSRETGPAQDFPPGLPSAAAVSDSTGAQTQVTSRSRCKSCSKRLVFGLPRVSNPASSNKGVCSPYLTAGWPQCTRSWGPWVAWHRLARENTLSAPSACTGPLAPVSQQRGCGAAEPRPLDRRLRKSLDRWLRSAVTACPSRCSGDQADSVGASLLNDHRKDSTP